MRVGSGPFRCSEPPPPNGAGMLDSLEIPPRSSIVIWLACVGSFVYGWTAARLQTGPSSPLHHALRATGTGSWCDTVRARKLGTDGEWLAVPVVAYSLRVICGPKFG